MNKINLPFYMLLLSLALALTLFACGGDDKIPVGDEDKKTADDDDDGVKYCETSVECGLGMTCSGGVCIEGDDDDDTPDASDDDDNDDDVAGPAIAEPEAITLDFGTVKTGQLKTMTAALKNIGGSPLTVTLVAITKGGMGFTLKEEFKGEKVVQPGEKLDIEVVFAPTDARSFSDTLNFVHDAEGSPATVYLMGVGSGGPANLTVTPSTEQVFSSVSVGSKSPSVKFILKNDAPEEANDVEIKTIEIPEPGNEHFTLSYPGTVPVALKAQATMTVEVAFEPTSEGDKAASLIIKSDDINNPTYSIPLKGKALAAGATFTPKSVDFGDIVYGQESAPQLVTITNSGSTPFHIEKIEAAPGSFVITEAPQPLPALVGVGAKRQIWVKFKPESEGEFEGLLTFTTTIAGAETLHVPLVGNGVALPVETPVAKAVVYGSQNTTANYMIGVTAPIELDGGSSTDPTTGPDSGITTYNWEFIDAPQNHDAQLQNATGDFRRVRFSTTTLGTYKIKLTVINKGGKASQNEAVVTIHAMYQQALVINADWENYNGTACGGGAGTSRSYPGTCIGDERNVDLILVGPGGKVCREPKPREDSSLTSYVCDWAELGAPVWKDAMGSNYRQPETIEYILEPQPSAFSLAVKISLEEDLYCYDGILPTLCGSSSCKNIGVCVTTTVKIDGVTEGTFSKVVLAKKGDNQELCGLEYDYGKWTLVTP